MIGKELTEVQLDTPSPLPYPHPMTTEQNTTANRGRAVKPRPIRRVGAVLGVSYPRLRIWISGITSEHGEWIDGRYLPATLHEYGATFDVWLYDDEPITHGAYTLQVSPTTGEPYTDEDLFGAGVSGSRDGDP